MNLTTKNKFMSTIVRINSKTRIMAKSKDNLANYKTKLNSNSLLGVSQKLEQKTPVKSIRNNEKEYKKLLNQIFNDKKFISEKLLNKNLKERFGASTWYRKRMMGLNMITINNGIVKLVQTNETNE